MNTRGRVGALLAAPRGCGHISGRPGVLWNTRRGVPGTQHPHGTKQVCTDTFTIRTSRVAQALAERAPWWMASRIATFFLLDTPVGKLLNDVSFSPPWRAPLCTPLERGWVKLWDIETARFSVASCNALAIVRVFTR